MKPMIEWKSAGVGCLWGIAGTIVFFISVALTAILLLNIQP